MLKDPNSAFRAFTIGKVHNAFCGFFEVAVATKGFLKEGRPVAEELLVDLEFLAFCANIEDDNVLSKRSGSSALENRKQMLCE